MTEAIAWIALGISVMSAIVASCAALIADKAQKEAHKHNKLSVTPHLVYDSKFSFEDGPYVKIRNCGLGPAKIIKFKVFFDNNFIEDANDCGWGNALNHIKQFDINCTVGGFHEGEAFVAGHLDNLINFAPKNNSEDIRNQQIKLTSALKKIKFEYESFYGEKQKPVVWDGSKDIPF